MYEHKDRKINYIFGLTAWGNRLKLEFGKLKDITLLNYQLDG